MNIHYFQHVPFEGLGSIEDWAVEKGHPVTVTRFYETFKLPDLVAIDWLIVLGGPLGVNDEQNFPWLKTEKEFIRQAIKANKVVIGICLGAQLIAQVLGAKVYKNKFTEIGWFPVEVFETAEKTNLLQNKITVFHWHGDSFDIPAGAVLAASSEACINQAFRYGKKVLGLQFHLEVTKQSIAKMIEHEGHELIPDIFVQSAEQIVTLQDKYLKQNNKAMFFILDHLEKL